MCNYLCCSPSAEDLPALKNLWRRVFQDDISFLDQFFSRWYDPSLTQIIKVGNSLAAMAYILPTGRFISLSGSFPAAMIYAVSCDPLYRGLGFGKVVTEYACRLAFESGYETVTLCPADNQLFDFYRSVNFETGFYIRQVSVHAQQPLSSLSLEPISDEGYYAIRETMLAGSPHLEVTPEYLALQRLLCYPNGGMAAVMENGSPIGCIIWENEDNRVTVKEYLCPVPAEQTLGLLGSDHAQFVLPGSITEKPFAMFRGKACCGYYGLAFG